MRDTNNTSIEGLEETPEYRPKCDVQLGSGSQYSATRIMEWCRKDGLAHLVENFDSRSPFPCIPETSPLKVTDILPRTPDSIRKLRPGQTFHDNTPPLDENARAQIGGFPSDSPVSDNNEPTGNSDLLLLAPPSNDENLPCSLTSDGHSGRPLSGPAAHEYMSGNHCDNDTASFSRGDAGDQDDLTYSSSEVSSRPRLPLRRVATVSLAARSAATGCVCSCSVASSSNSSSTTNGAPSNPTSSAPSSPQNLRRRRTSAPDASSFGLTPLGDSNAASGVASDRWTPSVGVASSTAVASSNSARLHQWRRSAGFRVRRPAWLRAAAATPSSSSSDLSGACCSTGASQRQPLPACCAQCRLCSPCPSTSSGSVAYSASNSSGPTVSSTECRGLMEMSFGTPSEDPTPPHLSGDSSCHHCPSNKIDNPHYHHHHHHRHPPPGYSHEHNSNSGYQHHHPPRQRSRTRYHSLLPVPEEEGAAPAALSTAGASPSTSGGMLLLTSGRCPTEEEERGDDDDDDDDVDDDQTPMPSQPPETPLAAETPAVPPPEPDSPDQPPPLPRCNSAPQLQQFEGPSQDQMQQPHGLHGALQMDDDKAGMLEAREDAEVTATAAVAASSAVAPTQPQMRPASAGAAVATAAQTSAIYTATTTLAANVPQERGDVTGGLEAVEHRAADCDADDNDGNNDVALLMTELNCQLKDLRLSATGVPFLDPDWARLQLLQSAPPADEGAALLAAVDVAALLRLLGQGLAQLAELRRWQSLAEAAPRGMTTRLQLFRQNDKLRTENTELQQNIESMKRVLSQQHGVYRERWKAEVALEASRKEAAALRQQLAVERQKSAQLALQTRQLKTRDGGVVARLRSSSVSTMSTLPATAVLSSSPPISQSLQGERELMDAAAEAIAAAAAADGTAAPDLQPIVVLPPMKLAVLLRSATEEARLCRRLAENFIRTFELRGYQDGIQAIAALKKKVQRSSWFLRQVCDLLQAPNPTAALTLLRRQLAIVHGGRLPADGGGKEGSAPATLSLATALLQKLEDPQRFLAAAGFALQTFQGIHKRLTLPEWEEQAQLLSGAEAILQALGSEQQHAESTQTSPSSSYVSTGLCSGDLPSALLQPAEQKQWRHWQGDCLFHVDLMARLAEENARAVVRGKGAAASVPSAPSSSAVAAAAAVAATTTAAV